MQVLVTETAESAEAAGGHPWALHKVRSQLGRNSRVVSAVHSSWSDVYPSIHGVVTAQGYAAWYFL